MLNFGLFRSSLSKERTANLKKIVVSSRGGFSIKSEALFQDKKSTVAFFKELRKTLYENPQTQKVEKSF